VDRPMIASIQQLFYLRSSRLSQINIRPADPGGKDPGQQTYHYFSSVFENIIWENGSSRNATASTFAMCVIFFFFNFSTMLHDFCFLINFLQAQEILLVMFCFR
jgi:hypothetical protein